MQIVTRQKLVMFSLSFISIFFYFLIILLVMFTYQAYDLFQVILIVFGIGTILSVFSSILIIRGHLEFEKPFAQTLIKLAIAHMPVVTATTICFILFI